jgi:protein-serine/threonine kinase
MPRAPASLAPLRLPGGGAAPSTFFYDPSGAFHRGDLEIGSTSSLPAAAGRAEEDLSLAAFEVKEVLGQGASSYVQRAVHARTREVYALKVISVASHSAREQLTREVSSLCALSRCAGLCALRGAFSGPANVYLALEFMDAGSLQELVAERGALPERALAGIAFQVFSALVSLHSRNYLHRDLKPTNVLLSKDGRVRLCDFGLAVALASSLDVAHTIVGTSRYMAPERVSGQTYSFPADVWAAGLILWCVAAGDTPWKGLSGFLELAEAILQPNAPAALLADPALAHCSPELRELIAHCICSHEKDRLPALALLGCPFFLRRHNVSSWQAAQEAVRDELFPRQQTEAAKLDEEDTLLLDHEAPTAVGMGPSHEGYETARSHARTLLAHAARDEEREGTASENPDIII